MGKICFGVDLGGTTVKMGIFTVDGAMLEEWEIPTRKDDGGKYILSDIADSINDKITTAAIDRADVVGVGIGVPGPVTSAGIVKGCVNLGWGDTAVEEILSDLTGFEAKAGNDANVAALGLKKIRSVVEHEDTPQIRGMINKVSHLVSVEEL